MMDVLRQARNKSTLAVVISILLLIGGCDRIDHWLAKNKPVQQKEHVIAKPKSQSAATLPDFTTLVEQQGPAVVNIQATRLDDQIGADGASTEGHSLPDNDPFYDYFKRMLPNIPQTPQTEDDEYNFGSGFIVSKDGYILTNAHVVSGLNHIKVLLNDKREYQARLIGADGQSDIALLKIDADHLPVVQTGDPKQLKVGEWVAAIGAPFGFDNSVTSGIVSAKGRSLPDANYTPFIQTDVAINPGNSGGPLFNLRGEVVGINSQIYSRSGGFMGISFAIPIDVAMNVARQLLHNGKVQRGRLGVVIQEVNYDLARAFGLDRASGALISQVIDSGPAAKAGLHIGDIVQSINGEEINNSSDLPVMVGLLTPGSKIALSVWRQSKAQQIPVVLDDVNNNSQTVNTALTTPAAVPFTGASFSVAKLGLTLQPVANGLMIRRVSGAALKSGLRRGDIILAFGAQMIHTAEDVQNLLANMGTNIPLLIKRGNNTLYVAVVES
ncbi:Do family serine endopeptidase [Neisseriaceae bacterium ESL0693]|nr:Do family serine endopeptidase [Neisseriaceae bacterium ESL0693]